MSPGQVPTLLPMSARVSVVVPVYNTAAYLETCLESLAEQTLADVEIVMVDDGSTDGSPAIAERFVTRDPRFRLVRQANAGLGAARNTGVDHCTGEFLSFVDGDDVVPRHAYEVLLAALDRTGSDFASGDIRRLTSLGTTSAFLAQVLERTRLETHITRDPDLVVDRIACNKLFRRSFWDRHGFRFPEGVLYEDIAVILPAHYLARSVDAIAETVYLWRRREGDDLSITQRRTETKALRDRVTAVNYVSRFLASQELTAPKLQYDRSVVAYDLRYFLDVLDRAGDEYRQLFLELVNDFLDRADARVLDQPLAIERLKWQLVRRRALPELLEVLRFQAEDLGETPPVRGLRHWYGDYPYRTDRPLGIPRRVYRLRDELALVSRVKDVRWDGDTLRIEGHAYIDMIGAPEKDSQKVEVVARPTGSVWRRARVAAEPVYRPDLTADESRVPVDLDWAGFRATLAPQQLRHGVAGDGGRWEIAVNVRARGVVRSGVHLEPASLHAVPVAELSVDGAHVRAGLSPGGKLMVRAQRRRFVVLSYFLDGGVLQFEGDVGPLAGEELVLQVSRRVGTATLEYPVYVDRSRGKPTFLARVPLADLVRALDVADEASRVEELGQGVAWDVSLVGARRERRLMLDAGLPEATFVVGARELVVHRTRFGNLTLIERSFRPVLRSAEWLPGGALLFGGFFQGPRGEYELVVRSRRDGESHAFPFQYEVEAQRFTAEVTPASVDSLAGVRPLAEGGWEFLVRPRGGGAAVHAVLDHRLLGELPVSATLEHKRFHFGVLGYESPLLRVGRDLDDDERGGFHQRRLRRVVYPARRRERPREAVLYDCFGGREYSDSPRRIHEELVRRAAALEHLWVVRDGAFRVPDTARAVRELSEEYYEAYARSRYVVANDHWPRWSARRPEQTWLQTWHGAPLKRHGLELAERPRAVREYRQIVAQASENWHYLVSPAPFATPILERAFPAGVQVIETGLPRTDVLLRPDRERLAEDVKRRLGLPTDSRVVLYAPTYRDHLQRRDGYRLGPLLDLADLRAALGDDHVLLFRKHRLAVGTLPAEADGVLDVSAFPDATELLLAVDVLVTDYSSAIFDFATLKRPMIFFTPDLEAYRDEIRGFSIDFESDAPGPLLKTTGEVIDALRHPNRLRADFKQRHERFLETYCPLNDGHATSRVVDHVFRW
jgi:CDP-glycerol glycerophosphotransferase